ncbi:MAG: hypothetical protein OEY64_04840 [Nitrospinota bacterium]|nr:hypothetical protein [Nitrospinota bacterium]
MGARISFFTILLLLNLSMSAFAGKLLTAGPVVDGGSGNNLGLIGIGIYHFSKESPTSFYVNSFFLTGDRSADNEVQTEDEMRGIYYRNYMLNIGATRSIFSWFGAYAGVGLGLKKAYEGWDTSGRPSTGSWLSSALSSGGNGTDPDFYKPKTSSDQWGLNVNAGIQILLPKVSLDVGYNTLTGNSYVGFGMVVEMP